jgi:hypothetical protein
MGRDSPILPAHKLEEALAAASQHREPRQQGAGAPASADGPAPSPATGSGGWGADVDVLEGLGFGGGGGSSGGLAASEFGSLLRSVIEAVVLEPDLVAFCIRPRSGHWNFLQVGCQR